MEGTGVRTRSVTTRPASAGRGAFTLIEVLVALAIIALLLSIILVAFGAARSTARAAAARQSASAIRIAIEQFQNDMGILPPLVKDVDPRYPGGAYASPPFTNTDPIEGGEPRVFNATNLSEANADDREYLRGWLPGGSTRLTTRVVNRADMRFSNYSLAWYLAGAADEIDPVEGPGMGRVTPLGGFAAGRAFGPYLATADAGLTVVDINREEGRVELRDRNDVPVRFYRWLNGRPGDSVVRYDTDEELTQLNVPGVVGGASIRTASGDPDDVEAITDTRLRSASWGVVLAGADGVFGDFAAEGAEALSAATGASSSDAEKLEEAAREDNIVEVGS